MVVETEDSAMVWMCDRGLALYHMKLGEAFYLMYEAVIACLYRRMPKSYLDATDFLAIQTHEGLGG
jgi:hypothetical protein